MYLSFDEGKEKGRESKKERKMERKSWLSKARYMAAQVALGSDEKPPSGNIC